MSAPHVLVSAERGGITMARASASETIDVLQRVGWRVGVLHDISDEADFHRQIAAQLGFGAHYGRNLDALWDCLTDLDGPVAVVWQHWQQWAIERPSAWARVLPVLTERAAIAPPFAVVLT